MTEHLELHFQRRPSLPRSSLISLVFLSIALDIGVARGAQPTVATDPDISDASPATQPAIGRVDKVLSRTPLTGFYQFEGARSVASPGHGSKLKNRLELQAQGRFSADVQWKLSAGASYDAIYDVSNFYPPSVRDDQRFDFIARENYLDFSAGDFDIRLGRQNIIWGEVPGLFIADVVSAKDLREFILPDFDLIRIPQWAARTEYTKGDFHGELVWIPVMSYDNIGKPGAEFYPFPPPPPAGYAFAIQDERRPPNTLANGAYGARASFLHTGWDAALFVYSSVDASLTFFRDIVTTPTPTFVYRPEHRRIRQYGGTLSKDFGGWLLRAESVYTAGRYFNVTRLDDADGVVRQDTFDYLLGVDWPMASEARLNLQFFQRIYRNHDPGILAERAESGVTFLYSMKLGQRLEPQILLIHSLNRAEWMARPKVVWGFSKDWYATFGADYFGGTATGLFGQFDHKDRVYVDVRRTF